jgi:pimeloyl-ACP methyl ester carboxylesterase
LFSQVIESLVSNIEADDLKKVAVPTLLMSGENDLWANPQQMLEMRGNIPVSEMLIINNAGHDIQYSCPQIVGPAILDFLKRYEKLQQGSCGSVMKQSATSF